MEYSKLARDIRWYRVGRLNRESIGIILVSLSGRGGIGDVPVDGSMYTLYPAIDMS